MKHGHGFCALLVLSASLPACAADNEAAVPSAYQNVMQAQYAAHTTAQPAPSEEAQRIYESYLRSIGQPAKNHSTDAGDISGMASH